jgi:hypothetical protein
VFFGVLPGGGTASVYNELPAGVRLLLRNMQKVDKGVCLEPVEEGEAPGLWEPNKIPYDHTKLGSYMKQGGGMLSFCDEETKKVAEGSRFGG